MSRDLDLAALRAAAESENLMAFLNVLGPGDVLALLDRLEAAEARLAVTDDMVEKGARAAAILGDYDGCFERLDEWANATEEERQIGCAEEPSGTDVEDAEWWRARIRAALVAALGEETTDARQM